MSTKFQRFGSQILNSTGQKYWKQALAEAQQAVPKGDEAQILLLGSRGSGQTDFIRALQTCARIPGHAASEMDMFDNTREAGVVDYACLNLRNRKAQTSHMVEQLDDESGIAEIEASVWMIYEPDVENISKPYLTTFLQKQCPEESEIVALIVCFDLSKPATVMSELAKWMSMLTKTLSALVDTKEGPNLDTQNTVVERLAMLRRMNASYAHGYKKKTENPEATIDDDAAAAADVSWLGLPLIFVGCNADVASATSEGKDIYDILMLHIRKLALQAGASIATVSSEPEVMAEQVGVLYDYLISRMLGAATVLAPATWTPFECIFVPAGWDTAEEIKDGISKTSVRNFNVPIETIIPDTSAAENEEEIAHIAATTDIGSETLRMAQKDTLTSFLTNFLAKNPSLADQYQLASPVSPGQPPAEDATQLAAPDSTRRIAPSPKPAQATSTAAAAAPGTAERSADKLTERQTERITSPLSPKSAVTTEKPARTPMPVAEPEVQTPTPLSPVAKPKRTTATAQPAATAAAAAAGDAGAAGEKQDLRKMLIGVAAKAGTATTGSPAAPRTSTKPKKPRSPQPQ